MRQDITQLLEEEKLRLSRRMKYNLEQALSLFPYEFSVDFVSNGKMIVYLPNKIIRSQLQGVIVIGECGISVFGKILNRSVSRFDSWTSVVSVDVKSLPFTGVFIDYRIKDGHRIIFQETYRGKKSFQQLKSLETTCAKYLSKSNNSSVA